MISRRVFSNYSNVQYEVIQRVNSCRKSEQMQNFSSLLELYGLSACDFESVDPQNTVVARRKKRIG